MMIETEKNSKRIRVDKMMLERKETKRKNQPGFF